MVIAKINTLTNNHNRKFLISVVFVILLFANTILASDRKETNQSKSAISIVLTTTNVNLRSGPGINYPSLSIIPKGTQLEVISISNAWYEVTYSHRKGYVFKKYLVLKERDIGEPRARTTYGLFSMLTIILLPFLWAIFLFNPVRPGYRLLTIRGHILLASVLVIAPSFKFLALILGENVFLSWYIIQLIISITNITDLILIGALFIKSVKTMKLEAIITLILVFSLIVYGGQIGGVGELSLSIISTAMSFDQILFEFLETKSIDKPMERYFTGFRY